MKNEGQRGAAGGNGRYPWIDYAKVISICLVIAYHIPPRTGGYAAGVMQMLRMPAFFLIAGYLFREGKFATLQQFVRHRSIQLLVPYTTFFLLFYLLWASVGRMLVGGGELDIPLWQPWAEWLWGSPSVVVAPYWFICCLLSVQILYWLLLHTLPRRWVVVAVMAAPYMNCVAHLDAWPWQLEAALDYLPFYALANLMKDNIRAWRARDWPVALLLCTGAMAAAWAGLQTGNEWVGCTCRTWGGMMMMPAYILVCKGIARLHLADKAAEFIGRNTIVVLALQNYFIGAIVMLADRFGGGWAAWAVGPVRVIVTLAVLAACLLPAMWINRYAPFLVGRGKFFNQILSRNEKTDICDSQPA